MKNILQKPAVRKILLILLGVLLFFIILDNLFFPWYVSSSETVVPSVVGKSEQDAFQILEDAGFDPKIADTSYGADFPKGHIFLQKPDAGKVVKEGRDIYLFISGGEQIVAVPKLKGKTLVDAKFSLERLELKLGRVKEIPSSQPKDMIFDQELAEGTRIKKGESVGVTISMGKGVGSITVPDLIGKSLAEARRILMDSSLVVGKVNYQISQSLLPNTILDQYPSKGNKINPGDQVDLFVTKAVEGENPLGLEE